MIDWHTHVLPEMDDGSRDVRESLLMLDELKSQGIEYVMATPHFLADEESVDAFLERRNLAYAKISPQLTHIFPKVILGAEVKYYPGISKLEGLSKLAIGDTGILLLEMPMSKWSEQTVREVIEISSLSGMTIVLAHIERYIDLQDKGVLDRLLDSGILMQVNARFFLSFSARRKAFKLLSRGKIHFVGSDCHNLTSRPPHIGSAYEHIKRKFGDRFFSQMTDFGYRLIKGNCRL